MKINKLAFEMFNKKHFDHCNEEQQNKIIKKLLDISTIKHFNK